MSESERAKRAARPVRRISKTMRDPRADSSPPLRPENVGRPRPTPDSAPSRLAALQTEVARLTHEREQEADDLAAMLVRIADAERTRTAALNMATELEARVEGLEAELDKARASMVELRGHLEQTRGAREAMEQELRGAKDATAAVEERAIQAEQAAYGSADGLSRARAELESQRVRIGELEERIAHAEEARDEAIHSLELDHATSLAEQQHDHAAALDALRRDHTAAQDALRRDQATALEVLRRDHAADLEEAHRQHADTRAVAAQLSTELESLRKSHAADLEALEAQQLEASRAMEARHAALTAAQHDAYVTARRAAARALEDERSTSAGLRQQASASECRWSALKAVVARATQALEEQQHHDEQAASLRARSLQQAIDTLQEDVLPSPPPVPTRPVLPSIDEEVTAALDEIDIDLIEVDPKA